MNRRLAVLLAMAMFVLVVDTSIMNVSISAVVRDLETTVSGVQSAIALEALVSAAFILIGSKVGDLIGRKRAYDARPAGIRHWRDRYDARPEPLRDHRLLGHHRRCRCVAVAPLDAVTYPWQLRGSSPKTGLCPCRRRGCHCGRSRTLAGRVHHYLSLLANRLPARGGDHRRRPVRHQDGA